jgi:integrase
MIVSPAPTTAAIAAPAAAPTVVPAVVVDTVPLPVALDPADSRLAGLTASWLAAKRSKHTRTVYRRDLEDWLAWCAAAGLDPLAARMVDVDRWIITERIAGGRRGRPLAETSIARRVSTISSWYGYLIRHTADDPRPLVTRNPARTDTRPRPDPDASTTVGLAGAETERLLAAAYADSATSAALILLLVLCGLRVGGAIAAQIEDLGHDRGHRVLTTTVKNGKLRRKPLPPLLAEAIDAMLAERRNPTDGSLFLTPSGIPIYELYVYRLIRRLARRAHLPAADRLTPHSLRHTAITELLDVSNGDLRRAQDFADHVDPRTTRRYDRARHSLDNHGAYDLAGRFAGARRLGEDLGAGR